MIPVSRPWLGPEEKENLISAFDSGYISSIGSFVKEFEDKFASYLNIKYAVSCSNGTAALMMSLKALGLSPGDEVIVPTLTFGATANAVAFLGGVPVFAGWDEFLQIDVSQIGELITEKTVGIIPVHLYGHPANMDPILEIAKKHGLWVLEDAAEALGAKYKGKPVGTIGDAGIFSFYGNKVITTGEGGMVVTLSEETYRKLRLIRDHGMQPRYFHIVQGANFRITNIQAAIGVAQMRKLDLVLKRRREVAELYIKYLKSFEKKYGFRLFKEAKWAHSIWWLFGATFTEDIKYEAVANYMAEKGIETRPLFKPLHLMPAFKDFPAHESLKRIKELEGIIFPSFYELKNEEVEKVCTVFLEALRNL